MPFKPLRYDNGKVVKMKCANSQAITKYDTLADNGSGYLALATSSTQNVTHVALETVTTASTGQEVLCLNVQGIQFLADCDAAWAQTDVGTLCDLADEDQVNPDSSSHDVFYIESGVGTAGTDTQVIGYFRQQTDA